MSFRILRCVPVLLLVAVGLVGCSDDVDEGGSGGSVSVAMPTDPMGQADAQAITDAANAILTQSASDTTAILFGVWDPDRGFLLGAVGDRSEGGAAATEDDAVRIGSITKTFTAAVVLKLVDEGTVDLSGTVRDYVPELATSDPAIADLTVEQLLDMHSGLADYLNGPEGVVADIVQDPTKVWDADELIAAGVAAGVEPPGTGGYSTPNYLILQRIAEQVTGSSLQSLIADRLTEPLGLGQTVLPPNDDSSLPDPHVNGLIGDSCVEELQADGATDAQAGTDTTDWSVSYGQGGGAMSSTVAELGTWAASMSGSSLLSDDLASQRMQIQDLGDGVQYGLGLQNLAGDWLGHVGEAIGWESLALHDPETDATLVIAMNGCHVIGPMVSLAAAVFPDTGFEQLLQG